MKASAHKGGLKRRSAPAVGGVRPITGYTDTNDDKNDDKNDEKNDEKNDDTGDSTGDSTDVDTDTGSPAKTPRKSNVAKGVNGRRQLGAKAQRVDSVVTPMAIASAVGCCVVRPKSEQPPRDLNQDNTPALCRSPSLAPARENTAAEGLTHNEHALPPNVSSASPLSIAPTLHQHNNNDSVLGAFTLEEQERGVRRLIQLMEEIAEEERKEEQERMAARSRKCENQ